MQKPSSYYQEKFNKAIDMYVKKYKLNVYSLIKFIEDKIAATPQTKNTIVQEITSMKSRQEQITREDLKMYLHLVAAAQAKINIRGKKLESFQHCYKLAFNENSKKQQGKASSQAKIQKKEENKVGSRRQTNIQQRIDLKKQKSQHIKKESQIGINRNGPNEQERDSASKKRGPKQVSSISPKRKLEIIQQDIVDQNRTSNVGFRTQNTQQILLKIPEAQMMNFKSNKSVQITGYEKFGQNYLNPLIKFHIVFEEYSVWRRYSQFQRLMIDLSRRFEGFILPELPPKQGIKSNLSYFRGVDEAFLNDRQQKLEEMMNSLLNSKFVNRDDTLQKFLTNQDFQIESSNEGGIISYLKPITAIGFNTKQLKTYGLAYYNYLKEFNKSEINTSVTVKYKEVERLLSFCLAIDNYRSAINANFEHRRDIFKQLKMDQYDRNLDITQFDRLSSTSASEIKNLSKEVNKYLELKSQESWLSYLIRQKEMEVQSDLEQLKKNKEDIAHRISSMEKNLMQSIEQLKDEKVEYLQSVGEKMIEWRKSIHP